MSSSESSTNSGKMVQDDDKVNNGETKDEEQEIGKLLSSPKTPRKSDEKGCLARPRKFLKKKLAKPRKFLKKNQEKVKSMYEAHISLFEAIGVAIALILMSSDVYTDGSSSNRICSAECTCGWDQYFWECEEPQDICDEGVINGTSAWEYCSLYTEAECSAKPPWPIPNMCQCSWAGDYCFTTCGTHAVINGVIAWEYCHIGDNSSASCAAQTETWPNPRSSIRHVYWCTISVSTIIIPSIINNYILLYSLLKGDKYQGIFEAAGISCLSTRKNIARCCLIIVATCQVLPFFSLGLNIVILMRNYLKYLRNKDAENSTEMNEINSNNDVDDESLEIDLSSMTMQASLLYAFTEDIPQFTIQSLFFARAAAGDNDGVTGGLTSNAIAGLVTSAISLSKAYTVYYVSNLPQDSSSLLLLFRTFTTAFMATGGRVLTSCIFSTTGYDSSRALIPIGTSVLILIPPYIIQLCHSCVRKKTQENVSTGNTNIHNVDQSQCLKALRLVGKVVIGLPSSILSDIKTSVGYANIINAESNSKKVKVLAVILFTGLRSLIFTVTMDGNSIYGLWVSAHFVIYALLNYRYTYNFDDTTTERTMSLTLLTIILSSYVCNSLVLLVNAKYRIQSLLVSILLLLVGFYRSLIVDYVTVSIMGVVILLNFISLVIVWIKMIMACVKALITTSPDQELVL